MIDDAGLIDFYEIKIHEAVSSVFRIFPVETSSSFHGSFLSRKESTKSESLVTTTLLERTFVDRGIGCSICQRQVQGVQRVMPVFEQEYGELPRELSVDEEPHAAFGSMRFTRLSRAA